MSHLLSPSFFASCRRIALSVACVAALSAGLVVFPEVWDSVALLIRGRANLELESLHQPHTVVGWKQDGLVLKDGRTIPLPGIRELPSTSPALTEMTKRGIEIAADGRVYGLVRVHHWCGNDPVASHLSRVDISDALMFLRVGITQKPIPRSYFAIQESHAGGRFSEWGWNISEHSQFESWQKSKNRM